MVSALFLLGAVGFTLVAAFQWMMSAGGKSAAPRMEHRTGRHLLANLDSPNYYSRLEAGRQGAPRRRARRGGRLRISAVIAAS
jgi:hypothetical protein